MAESEEENSEGKVRCCGRSWFELAVDTGKTYHYNWLCVINLAVLYNLIIVPGRMVFWELDNMLDTTWMVLDYICDFLYTLDTFVRMHEGYLEQGLLVKKPNLLRKNYFNSRYFPLNVIRYYNIISTSYVDHLQLILVVQNTQHNICRQ